LRRNGNRIARHGWAGLVWDRKSKKKINTILLFPTKDSIGAKTKYEREVLA